MSEGKIGHRPPGTPKTGGRKKGSKNKPKAAPSVDTSVSVSVATAGGGGAPGEPNIFAPQAGARARAGRNAASEAGFPRHRIVATASLVGYENNPRTHSPAQIDKLVASIKEFGFTNAILTDGKRGVVAGHGRLLAAQKLGLVTVPTLELSHLSAAQRRAYVIADNKLALDAGWDNDLLTFELGELRLDGFDLSLTGFDLGELSNLFGENGNEGLTDPDDIPPLAEPVSVLGDVWILGRHRLMAGDSTSPDHVAALMQGAQADLCFTSPPYAEQRDYKGGGLPWDELMQGVFANLPVTHEAQVLVNLGMVHRDGEWMPYWDGWIEWMRTTGWRRFGWYVWDQGPGLSGDWFGRLAPSHEWVFHFNRVAERARKTKDSKHAGEIQRNGLMRNPDGSMGGGRATKGPSVIQARKVPDSVIRIIRHKGGLPGDVGAHPAIFPIELVSEIMTAFSDPGDTVYEPFIGSGTQLIAAEKHDRTCFGMEIAAAYVDVAIRRWQAFAGQEATHADGRTFAAIELDRAASPKAARTKTRAKVAA